MNKHYSTLLLTLCAFLFFITQSSATEVNGYRCSFPISEGNQSLRRFTLTVEVYHCLRYSQYGDLIIVNSEQQAVPYYLTTAGPKTDSIQIKKDIVFYQEPAARVYKTGDQIRRIAQLTGIESGNESDTQWQQKNVFYSSLILEQNKTDDTLKNITINTKTTDQSSSATIIIEASDDLQHWSTLLRPHNLFFLPGENNTGHLNNKTLNVSASKTTKYLRLAALSNIEHFTENITGITGEYEQTTNTAPALQWLSANTLGSFHEENEWLLPLPDLMPVTRIRFTPASNIAYYQGAIYSQPYINPVNGNTNKQIRNDGKKKIKALLKNTVKGRRNSRPSPANSWRYISSFSQYRLQTENSTVISPDIRIPTTQSKLWKFKFEQPKALHSAQLPKIELGWQPPQVSFIAQGPGPFHLLAGNTETAQKLIFPHHLVAINEKVETVKLLAAISDNYNEAAVKKDAQAKKQYNWNTILLWLVLLIGVALMATMAYQLAKKMQEK